MRLRRLKDSLDPVTAVYLPLLDAAGFKTTDQVIHTPLNTLLDLISGDETQYGLPIPFNREAYDLILDACLDADIGHAFHRGASVGESIITHDLAWSGFNLRPLDELLTLPANPHQSSTPSIIIDIAGPPRSGKTLLALHLVLNYLRSDEARERGTRCTWIDTTGRFEAERALGVLEGMRCEDPEQILDRLELVSCFDMSDLLAATLTDLESRLTAEIEAMVGPEDEDVEHAGAESLEDWQGTGQARRRSVGDATTKIDDRDPAVHSKMDVKTNSDERSHRVRHRGFDAFAESTGTPKTRMLVLDCVSTILLPVLQGGTTQGQARVSDLMDGLLMLVKKYGMTCLTHASHFPAPVDPPKIGLCSSALPIEKQLLQSTSSIHPTNPLSAFSTTTIKPALSANPSSAVGGTTWNFGADVEVLLQDARGVFGSGGKEGGGKVGIMSAGGANAGPMEQTQSSGTQGGQGQSGDTGQGDEGRRVIEVLSSRIGPSGIWAVFDTDGINLYDPLTD